MQGHGSGSPSSSGSGCPRNRRPQGRAASCPTNAGVPDLAARLAQADLALRDHSGPDSSGDSDGRDTLVQAQLAEEELEQRSNTGSSLSGDTNPTSRSDDATHADKEHEPEQGRRRDPEAGSCHPSRYGRSTSGSVTRSSEESAPPCSTGSSSDSWTNQDLWEKYWESQKEQKAKDRDIAELRLTMDSMAKKHGMEMDLMHRELERTAKREAQKAEETRREKRPEVLTNRVKAMEAKRQHTEREDGDLQDHEGRSSAKTRNLKDELTTKLEEQNVIKEHNPEAQEANNAQIRSVNLQPERGLQSVKSESKNVVAGRDVLRHNPKHMQRAEETTSPKEKLDTASSELRRAHGEVTDLASTAPSEQEKGADQSAQRVQTREENRKMTAELSELRLQMLGIQQAEEKDKGAPEDAAAAASADPQDGSGHAPAESTVGDLQMLLRNANSKCLDMPHEPVFPNKSQSLNLKTKVRGPRFTKVKGMGGGFMKLTSIDECDLDFSMDGSAAASGNVSSEGVDWVVGNLQDFDEVDPALGLTPPDQQEKPTSDLVKSLIQERTAMQSKIDELRGKLAEEHIAVDEIKEELAEKEARHNSKVARLMGMLEASKGASNEATQELRDLKHLSERKDSEHKTQMDELKRQLALSEQRFQEIQSQHTAMKQTKAVVPPRQSAAQRAEEQQLVESLRQQLFGAQEAKRIAEGRLEEFKRAMEVMEKQHADTVSDLKQQLASGSSSLRRGSSDSTADGPHSPDHQQEDLKQQLRSSIEERNVLMNSLEWKEVQWQSNVENLEMNHAAEMKDLQRSHETEVRNLTSKLEGELDQARQKLAEARKEVSKAKDTPAPVRAPQAPAWLSLLKCPVRAPTGATPDAACTQDGCWRLLSTMQGTIALMCSVRDYKIEEATRTACMTWGSGALHGESVLTLVSKPSRAVWLRKAFQMHQSIAESKGQSEGTHSLVLRELGCEEFTSRSGRGFDASIITVNFPSEDSSNKEALLLVIIEPQKTQNPQESPGSSSGVGAPAAMANHNTSGSASRMDKRGGHSSGHSEVSTIHPSDSASNIQYMSLGRC